MREWSDLLALTGPKSLVVERVRIGESGIAVEGAFELPQLVRLSPEDQVFVAAFVKSHGSIKEMEQVFGVSYPTIKARLNRISAQLEFVETNPVSPKSEILGRLERGEIDAQDAIRALEALR